MDTTRIKFLVNAHNSGGGHAHQAQSFKAGEIYDLPHASSQHWLTRKKAIIVIDEPTPIDPLAQPGDVISDADALGAEVTEDLLVDDPDKSINAPPADKMLKKTRSKKSE